MSRTQTPETKAKISAGMKAAHVRRKETKFYEASPTQERIDSLKENFKLGHPDKLSPNVRNYGGLGRDVHPTEKVESKSAALPTHQERYAAAKTSAEALGVRQAAEVVTKKSGEHGGKTQPTHLPPTRSQNERSQLRDQRAGLQAKRAGV